MTEREFWKRALTGLALLVLLEAIGVGWSIYNYWEIARTGSTEQWLGLAHHIAQISVPIYAAYSLALAMFFPWRDAQQSNR